MEIFLTKQCETLTGSLGKGYGYYIRKAPNKEGSVRFFSQRSKWNVPADGHLRFIFACAQLAQMKTHITDIRVTRKELSDALWEAGRKQISNIVLGDDDLPDYISATDVLTLKEKLNL
jgi:hypothetical protein